MTDCALLSFADSWGFDYSSYRPSKNILRVIPFNSSRKKMITAVYNEETNGLRIFVKGASELVLSDCQYFIDQEGSTI